MILDKGNVYLLLGSNLGDKKGLINKAVCEMEKRIGSIVAKSSYYQTAAWGKTDQPEFLNLAVHIKTLGSPLTVLHQALAIENELGRIRFEKWGSRLIDIDVILYDDLVVDIPNELQIPHPEMANRRFVLQPLAEIAGHVIHPVTKKSVSEMLISLEDQLKVSEI